MRYELINKFDVAAPADAIWAVYSSPTLPKLVVELLPGVFDRIEIVQGDGRLGTVLHLVYPPGSVPLSYKEKFVTIDHHRRLKEVQQIEGGYLEMGCTFYMDSFEILEKDCDSCTIKSVTKYEVNDERAPDVSPLISVDSLVTMARAISKYVLDKKKTGSSYDDDDCDDEDNPMKHAHGHGHGFWHRHDGHGHGHDGFGHGGHGHDEHGHGDDGYGHGDC
ncbi:Bet v I domain [Macleaya cordata]|uniref:Bet v I domain n=1 Tax=Macleaya cordata TaxID=56857 RepID=A0A200PXD7_MACCD|nr:Bet v I domain [Macleaya cordata]